jgi:hypothetical protein
MTRAVSAGSRGISTSTMKTDPIITPAILAMFKRLLEIELEEEGDRGSEQSRLRKMLYAALKTDPWNIGQLRLDRDRPPPWVRPFPEIGRTLATRTSRVRGGSRRRSRRSLQQAAALATLKRRERTPRLRTAPSQAASRGSLKFAVWGVLTPGLILCGAACR